MKKIFLAITIGLFAVSTFAQKQQNRHEFSIWGAGGISSLEYNPSMGEHKTGFGGFAGLGYNYFFNYNWSLGIGGEFSILNAKTKFPLVSDSYTVVDYTSVNHLRLFIEGQNNEEKQQAYYVNIPLMVKFQTDWFKGHKFYAAFGPKIGIPIQSTYNSTGALTVKGQLLSLSGEPATKDLYTDMPHHGFGTFSRSQENDLDFELDFIAAAEVGIKWKLNNSWSLYSGLYVDYGLNDIRGGEERDQNMNFYDYNRNKPDNYAANSMLFSQSTQNGSTQSITDKVNTLGVGVKLQLAFGIKPFDKKESIKSAQYSSNKPYEGLTASQMEDIMNRNTNNIIKAQQAELEALKKNNPTVSTEEPDLSSCIAGFDLDKKNILSSMYAELDRKIAVMKKFPKTNVILEGHTDDQGSDEHNYQLGLDRANAVKSYMIERGIKAERLSVTSKGKSQPVIPNSDETQRRYNRRVEFILK